MKQLLVQLPASQRIIFRRDNGYFVGALLDHLDGSSVNFGIAPKAGMHHGFWLQSGEKRKEDIRHNKNYSRSTVTTIFVTSPQRIIRRGKRINITGS